MQLPCTYENEVLTIKCLNLSATAWPLEEAFALVVKNTPEFYASLSLGTIHKENGRCFIVVPKSDKLYNKILELEPLPEDQDKKKKQNSLLKDVSPEEVLKFGY